MSLAAIGCEGQGDLQRSALRPGVCLGGMVAAESSAAAANEPVEIEIPVAQGDSTLARAWVPAARTEASSIGIIFVTGVDGGWLEPADNIYAWLGAEFARKGIPSIFVKYRWAGGYLPESLEDTKGAAQYLRELGVSRMAILAWSFGGAVMTHAAREIPEIATIVGFAPQSDQTVPILADQSLLLIHSHDDENVPITGSQDILADAPPGARREFRPLWGYNHALDAASPELQPLVKTWLEHELSTDPECRG